MIARDEMMLRLIEACPSFRSQWDDFVKEWSDEPVPLPHYLALTTLARHLIELLEGGETKTFTATFAVVEQLHVDGDSYVREAISVGFLEDLQNSSFYKRANSSQFEPFLEPESRRWWEKIKGFWERGQMLIDD